MRWGLLSDYAQDYITNAFDAQILELYSFSGKPVFDHENLLPIVSGAENKVIPQLLPKSVQDDLRMSDRSAGSFERQLNVCVAVQTRGTTFMQRILSPHLNSA